MKVPKRVYIAIAVLLFLSGGGAALALRPDEPVKKVSVQQVSAVESVEEQPVIDDSKVVVQEATPELETPVETPAEPEESLKEKIKREVEALATSRGLNDVGEFHSDLVWLQSHCIDRMIENSGGYNDEIKAQKYADMYLVGVVNDQGNLMKMWFDSGDCGGKWYMPPAN